jgi:hypothetical protein
MTGHEQPEERATEPRYLWLAMNAGLWEPFRLEHRLAQAIASSGREITMIHCSGVLDTYCPVMASRRLTVDSSRGLKRQACTDCRHNARITEEVANYGIALLDTFATPARRAQARALVEIVTPENYTDFKVDGVPVGRYATYLALLQHKVSEVTSTRASWEEYLSDLYDALVVHFCAPEIFAAFAPTHLVVYNPLYPTNRMFVEYARAHGVQLVSVTAGSFVPARLETVGIYPHLLAGQTLPDSPEIVNSLEFPLSDQEVRAVGAHIWALIGGNDPWVYSVSPSRIPETEIRQRLGLRADSPVATVLVSSPDETRASFLVDAEIQRDPENGYSSIPEFLRASIACAERLPDVDFVFRLHPRLLPNKREHVVSPDFAEIMGILEDLPANARINSPSDELSLYDMLRISSCGINQSSSTGLEFMAFGTPVVQYDPVRMALYPVQLTRCVMRGDTEGFVSSVEAAIADQGGLKISRMAFRWLGISLLRVLLHLRTMDSLQALHPSFANLTAEDDEETVASVPSKSTLRTVIPASLRERAARFLDRRTREATIPDPSADTWWVDEFIARLDSTVGGPIWKPPVIPRGSGTLDSETEAIVEELAELRRFLGMSATGEDPA